MRVVFKVGMICYWTVFTLGMLCSIMGILSGRGGWADAAYVYLIVQVILAVPLLIMVALGYHEDKRWD